MTIPQTGPVSSLLHLPASESAERSSSPMDAFGKVIDQLLSAHATTEAKADQAVLDLALGRTDDLHSVALATSMADISFRKILEVRNRLLESYQEIMRMQV
jgi:flagellar hook-basal body complex protein FliE